jgi:hypothetical protein
MFMDSGADISIIEEDLLPEGAVQCYPEIVNGITRDTALVQAEIGGTKLTFYAAVVPKGTFSHPVIVGRDTLHHKVVWTHTLVPKTDTDGGITVVEEGEQSCVTPSMVLGLEEEEKETKKRRRKTKFASADTVAEVAAQPLDTPSTLTSPGEVIQTKMRRRQKKFATVATVVLFTGTSADPSDTLTIPEEKTGEVKQNKSRSSAQQLE